MEKVLPVPFAGCWLWHGAVSKCKGGGYGLIYVGGKEVVKSAHRVVYELERGAIPNGMDLDHLCRVRTCVNPAHLEPVTRKENLRRGLKGGPKPKKKT